MAGIDKSKEELGWMKVIFGVALVTDISLIAWVAQNYHRAPDLLLLIGVICILMVTLVIVRMDQVARGKISELEDR